MKKLLTLTIISSLFLLGGCAGGKNKGKLITNNDAQELIDNAELMLAKKDYSSKFIQKAVEKNKVSYELESKISFDIDYTSEFTCNIDKTDNAMLLSRYSTQYGNSKGSGTDWLNDTTSNGSFCVRYNAKSADDFCKKLNEKSIRTGSGDRYYEYSATNNETTRFVK